MKVDQLCTSNLMLRAIYLCASRARNRIVWWDKDRNDVLTRD